MLTRVAPSVFACEQLKQENAILRRERNSLAPQDTSGGALEAYSCHTVAEPALQRRAVPSPSHVHLCPSSPQPPSARRLFFEAESGRPAADGRTDGQKEEADILKSGVKVIICVRVFKMLRARACCLPAARGFIRGRTRVCISLLNSTC
jgi:hypothetical protein